MSKSVYLAGDIMGRGARLARQEEYGLIKDVLPDEYDIYSPVLNESINNKTDITVEYNNTLAERIVAADCERLKAADMVVIDSDEGAIGTTVETGYLLGRKDLAKEIRDIIDEQNLWQDCSDDVLNDIGNKINGILSQEVYVHNDDLRRTDIPEIGDRRSHSRNQFLYGAVLKLTSGMGIQSLNEVITQLQNHR